jgi:hypothetical protein
MYAMFRQAVAEGTISADDLRYILDGPIDDGKVKDAPQVVLQTGRSVVAPGFDQRLSLQEEAKREVAGTVSEAKKADDDLLKGIPNIDELLAPGRFESTPLDRPLSADKDIELKEMQVLPLVRYGIRIRGENPKAKGARRFFLRMQTRAEHDADPSSDRVYETCGAYIQRLVNALKTENDRLEQALLTPGVPLSTFLVRFVWALAGKLGTTPTVLTEGAPMTKYATPVAAANRVLAWMSGTSILVDVPVIYAMAINLGVKRPDYWDGSNEDFERSKQLVRTAVYPLLINIFRILYQAFLSGRQPSFAYPQKPASWASLYIERTPPEVAAAMAAAKAPPAPAAAPPPLVPPAPVPVSMDVIQPPPAPAAAASPSLPPPPPKKTLVEKAAAAAAAKKASREKRKVEREQEEAKKRREMLELTPEQRVVHIIEMLLDFTKQAIVLDKWLREHPAPASDAPEADKKRYEDEKPKVKMVKISKDIAYHVWLVVRRLFRRAVEIKLKSEVGEAELDLAEDLSSTADSGFTEQDSGFTEQEYPALIACFTGSFIDDFVESLIGMWEAALDPKNAEDAPAPQPDDAYFSNADPASSKIWAAFKDSDVETYFSNLAMNVMRRAQKCLQFFPTGDLSERNIEIFYNELVVEPDFSSEDGWRAASKESRQEAKKDFRNYQRSLASAVRKLKDNFIAVVEDPEVEDILLGGVREEGEEGSSDVEEQEAPPEERMFQRLVEHSSQLDKYREVLAAGPSDQELSTMRNDALLRARSEVAQMSDQDVQRELEFLARLGTANVVAKPPPYQLEDKVPIEKDLQERYVMEAIERFLKRNKSPYSMAQYTLARGFVEDDKTEKAKLNAKEQEERDRAAAEAKRRKERRQKEDEEDEKRLAAIIADEEKETKAGGAPPGKRGRVIIEDEDEPPVPTPAPMAVTPAPAPVPAPKKRIAPTLVSGPTVSQALVPAAPAAPEQPSKKRQLEEQRVEAEKVEAKLERKKKVVPAAADAGKEARPFQGGWKQLIYDENMLGKAPAPEEKTQVKELSKDEKKRRNLLRAPATSTEQLEKKRQEFTDLVPKDLTDRAALVRALPEAKLNDVYLGHVLSTIGIGAQDDSIRNELVEKWIRANRKELERHVESLIRDKQAAQMNDQQFEEERGSSEYALLPGNLKLLLEWDPLTDQMVQADLFMASVLSRAGALAKITTARQLRELVDTAIEVYDKRGKRQNPFYSAMVRAAVAVPMKLAYDQNRLALDLLNDPQLQDREGQRKLDRVCEAVEVRYVAQVEDLIGPYWFKEKSRGPEMQFWQGVVGEYARLLFAPVIRLDSGQYGLYGERVQAVPEVKQVVDDWNKTFGAELFPAFKLVFEKKLAARASTKPAAVVIILESSEEEKLDKDRVVQSKVPEPERALPPPAAIVPLDVDIPSADAPAPQLSPVPEVHAWQSIPDDWDVPQVLAAADAGAIEEQKLPPAASLSNPAVASLDTLSLEEIQPAVVPQQGSRSDWLSHRNAVLNAINRQGLDNVPLSQVLSIICVADFVLAADDPQNLYVIYEREELEESPHTGLAAYVPLLLRTAKSAQQVLAVLRSPLSWRYYYAKTFYGSRGEDRNMPAGFYAAQTLLLGSWEQQFKVYYHQLVSHALFGTKGLKLVDSSCSLPFGTVNLVTAAVCNYHDPASGKPSLAFMCHIPEKSFLESFGRRTTVQVTVMRDNETVSSLFNYDGNSHDYVASVPYITPAHQNPAISRAKPSVRIDFVLGRDADHCRFQVSAVGVRNVELPAPLNLTGVLYADSRPSVVQPSVQRPEFDVMQVFRCTTSDSVLRANGDFGNETREIYFPYSTDNAAQNARIDRTAGAAFTVHLNAQGALERAVAEKGTIPNTPAPLPRLENIVVVQKDSEYSREAFQQPMARVLSEVGDPQRTMIVVHLECYDRVNKLFWAPSITYHDAQTLVRRPPSESDLALFMNLVLKDINGTMTQELRVHYQRPSSPLASPLNPNETSYSSVALPLPLTLGHTDTTLVHDSLLAINHINGVVSCISNIEARIQERETAAFSSSGTPVQRMVSAAINSAKVPQCWECKSEIRNIGSAYAVPTESGVTMFICSKNCASKVPHVGLVGEELQAMRSVEKKLSCTELYMEHTDAADVWDQMSVAALGCWIFRNRSEGKVASLLGDFDRRRNALVNHYHLHAMSNPNIAEMVKLLTGGIRGALVQQQQQTIKKNNANEEGYYKSQLLSSTGGKRYADSAVAYMFQYRGAILNAFELFQARKYDLGAAAFSTALKTSHTLVNELILLNGDELLDNSAVPTTRPSGKRYTPPHIKPSHEGRFTAWAHRHGFSSAASAESAGLHSKNPRIRREANFARNAAQWHHVGRASLIGAPLSLIGAPIGEPLALIGQKRTAAVRDLAKWGRKHHLRRLSLAEHAALLTKNSRVRSEARSVLHTTGPHLRHVGKPIQPLNPKHQGEFTRWMHSHHYSSMAAAEKAGLRSKNTHVERMANFARNASKWHHTRHVREKLSGVSQLVKQAREIDAPLVSSFSSLTVSAAATTATTINNVIRL